LPQGSSSPISDLAGRAVELLLCAAIDFLMVVAVAVAVARRAVERLVGAPALAGGRNSNRQIGEGLAALHPIMSGS